MGKLLFILVLAGALGGAAWLVHERGVRGVARLTAKGLRAGVDWLDSISKPPAHATPPPPRHSPTRTVAKAAPPRAGRDGIVAQPKESLEARERAALDRLVSTRR